MLLVLARRLEEAKANILALWEERTRRALPAATRHGHLVLLDGLPGVMDEVVRSLEHEETAAGAEDSEGASQHGRQRATATEFSLEQVLLEHEIMREVMFEVLEAQQPLRVDEREALLRQIALRIRASARAFALIRDERRDNAERDLQQLNATLERTVTERTAELSRTEARFAVLVDGVRDYAIFTTDPRGFITSWNAGAERMKGYTVGEIVGTHFSILYPEQAKVRDEPMTHLRAATVEGRFRGEGLRRRKSGEEFLADVLITPMYEGPQLLGFSKVVQDLSERSSLLQERDLLRIDAERLHAEASARERFFTTLSHDLRSPLSTAKMAAQVLGRSVPSPDHVGELVQRISDDIDRADRMLVELLDESRAAAGRVIKLELEDCDLLQIAKDVCEDLGARHGPRFTVIAEGPARGFWNADALRRVLENLLSNAVKYGAPSTPITIRLRRRDPRMIVFVHNHGSSIPLVDQAELFEPFHRAPLATTSSQPGWGLGLTLVRAVVEALKGEVTLSSYPNEGTMFTIDLPVDPRTKA